MRRMKTVGIILTAVVILMWFTLPWSREIHKAAKIGDVEKVKVLLAENPALVNTKNHYGETPLYYAALWNHKEVVEVLLANKADVNARDNNGETPLGLAAYNGYKELVEILLANKADVNVKTRDSGWTPLHEAVFLGRKEVVEVLLVNKADVNAQDKDGKTPLDLALSHNDNDIAEILRAHGAK